jgi:hypothetical protein
MPRPGAKPTREGNMKDISNFNILAYLTDKGISYDTSGDNVGEGWIGINCPFPYCNDSLNHMGINLMHKTFNCFVCGEKGSIVKLIAIIESCSYGKAMSIVEGYEETPTNKYLRKEIKPTDRATVCKFPAETLDTFPKKFEEYLESRNFSPNYIIPKYNLHATRNAGRYANRIIIPYFLGGKMMVYHTRSINKEGGYRACHKEDAPVTIKELLYNEDQVKDTLLIVEGCLDVWRMGDGCCGISGTSYTATQIAHILALKPKHCFIMLDADATKVAHKLALELAPILPHVEVIQLSEGDPADLTKEEAIRLRKELKL